MAGQGRNLGRYVALLLLALTLSACFRSPAPEPLAPLVGPNGLTVENLDGAPFNDRLVFSRIGSLSSPPTNGVHDLVTVRVKNTSTSPVDISALAIGGADAADWRLEAPPPLPTTLAPGAQLDLKVKFVAEAGRRVHNGTLTLSSNDPAQPQLVIQLAGWWQSVSEGGQEPSLQKVVDTFGYKTVITASGQNLNQQGLFAAVGDEILSPYWRRADAASPVTVQQLAAFHKYPDTASIFWYPKGSSTKTTIVSHIGQDAQSLLPRKNGSSLAAASFTPGSELFGFGSGNEFSDWRKNNGQKDLGNGCAGTIPQDCGHHVRFWPVKDRSGNLVPDTYLMAMDYSGINYDYNDNVYLISNITPEAQATYRLNIAGGAYTDKSGNAWMPDSGFYVPTDAKDEGGISQDIANTDDDTLYQTYRAFLPNKPNLADRVLVYNLPVPPGDYDLRLYFAEIYWDAPGKRVFDVSVEGTTVLDNFDILTETNKFSALTKTFPKVNVADGMLTLRLKAEVDFGALSALEVLPAGTATLPSPTVTGTSPGNGATAVFRDTAVAADVELPNLGAGVDEKTLSTTTVRLFKTSGAAGVPGTVNTTGGNDAIVYQPSVLLDPNTNYTFQVTSSVKDQAGAPFTPFTMSFTTGTQTSVKTDPNVSFTKASVFSGSPISTLVIGPDGKLYGAGLDGVIRRWQINGNGQLQGEQTFRGLSGKAVVGMTFNPNDTKEIYLWTTANEPLYPQPAPDFSGKLYKLRLRGINFVDSDLQLYITGLPRSAKDHLSNSLAFGPDGLLYMNQGSNSAMGAPDSAWYNRPERLLSAAVLQIDPRRTTGLPINVQTEACDEHCQGTGSTGNYNPYAPDAPVKLYATGVRNAYDLLWHSNGKLYVPTNGSAAGGNTPDNPATPQNEALINVATQDDFLFKVEPGGYYGHPNATRGEYILNGGNPTAGVDPAEVVATGSYAGYPVGTPPDPSYRGFTYNFGRNRSPNGVIEYKSSTFGGRLKGKLLVVEYSGGDDILALPLGADGNVVKSEVTQVVAGLSDPLDLIEDTRNGNLYVAELVGGGTSGKISLLRSNVTPTNSPPAVDAGVDQSITSTTANLDATVSDDGQPNNTLTTTWRKVVGPGTVTFGNAAAVDTTARFSEVGTYVLELTASDGALSNSARVTIAVQVPSTGPAVSSLVLINADTDQVIRQLSNGDTIDYTALGTSNINIRADTNPAAVGSVSFNLDGRPYRIENVAPYALEGDVYKSDPPDYYPLSPALALGSHTLTATAYTDRSAGGTAGSALTVNFTVSQGAPANKPPTAGFSSNCTDLNCTFSDSSLDSDGSVTAWDWSFGDGTASSTRNPAHTYSVPGTYTVSLRVTDDGGATNTSSKTLSVSAASSSGPVVTSFSLINADTDREVGRLTEGMIVDYTALGTSNLSVRANTSPATTGSVSFNLDGSPYRVENYAPYSLAGDGSSGTDYYPVSPALAPGNHRLAATAYSDRSTGGSAGAALTVNFTVRQGPAANTPPTANFSANCTNLNCTFSDTSTDTGGSVTAWNWSFGDGASANSRNPAHTYGAAGTYTVSLTVTDDGGATNTLSKTLQVTAASTGPAVASLTLVNADTDRDVGPLTEGANIDYTALGTQNVSVRANPGSGTVGSVSFNLDGRPYRIENIAPYALAGDGSSGADYYALSPVLAPGSHTLQVTAYSERSAGGSAGATLTVNFTVSQGAPANTPPTAGFSSNCTDLNCTFNDTSTDTGGSVTAWAWTFGDGATSSTRNPSHSYSAPGTYTVSLRVTDDGGATNTSSKTLSVSAAPSSASTVTGFVLINADTDQVIRQLSNGDTIDYTALGTSNINIRADTNPAAVGSVSFNLDGSPYRVENYAPYSLAGEVWRGGPTSEYYAIDPALSPGRHTLTATTSTEKYGGGSVGGTLTISFTVTQGTASNNLSWRTVAAAPLGLTEAQGVVVGGKLYVFGGYTSFNPVTITPKVGVYDAAADSWASLPDAPALLTHAGTTVDGGTVYVAGGYVGKAGGGQTFATRDVWKYDVGASTWTPLPQLPAARGGGQLVRLGRVLHYFGGSDSNRADRAEHWQLSLDGGTAWTSAAPLPVAVNHHGAVVLNGKIYSIGGQKGQDSSAVAQASVYVWDASAPGSWTTGESLPKARSHIMMSSFVLNGRLVVAGGDSAGGGSLSDMTAYDPVTATWASLTPLPAARVAGVGVALGSTIVFTTGSGQRTTYKGITN